MNFMPFGQLKSFLKILIEVQYQSPSVTALPEGDPRGCPRIWDEKWSVSVPIRSIHCFMTTH